MYTYQKFMTYTWRHGLYWIHMNMDHIILSAKMTLSKFSGFQKLVIITGNKREEGKPWSISAEYNHEWNDYVEG